MPGFVGHAGSELELIGLTVIWVLPVPEDGPGPWADVDR